MTTPVRVRSPLADFGSRRRRVVALGVICLAELLVVLDNTIINVALPDMGLELKTTVSGLQWVVDAYTLTFASLLLPFGNLGDRYGRKRVMIVGLLGVVAASILGSRAVALSTAIGARALMGAFAAAVFPATLAMISNLFPDRGERARAIAVWTAMAGISVAIGPLVGGWLLDRFSWHSVFWVNIPIGLAVAALAVVFLPESKAAHNGPIDPVGVVISVAGITTFVWGIIEAPWHGWLSRTTLGACGIGLALLAIFVLWELRSGSPILNMHLFRARGFALPALAVAVAYFALFGILFLITQYCQGVREYSALGYGVAALPIAATLAVCAPVATLLTRKVGTTPIVVTGLLLTALGLYLGGLLGLDSSYVAGALPPMIALSAGVAFIQGPATESIMAHVPMDEAGAGSAVNDTTRAVGGTLGVAVLGSIMATHYAARVDPILARTPDWVMAPTQKEFVRSSILSVRAIHNYKVPPDMAARREELMLVMKKAFIAGSHLACHYAAAIVFLCALVVAFFLPTRRKDAVVK